jgi:glycosyltransferase involved in cell wall biosynthesis
LEAAGGGIVTPPGDAQALAQALIALRDDPERRRRLGMAGRRYVEEHLSWDNLVTDWLEQLAERGIK